MSSSAGEWVIGMNATFPRHDGVHGISNRRTRFVDHSDLPEHPSSGNYCAQSIFSRKPGSADRQLHPVGLPVTPSILKRTNAQLRQPTFR